MWQMAQLSAFIVLLEFLFGINVGLVPQRDLGVSP